MSHDDTNLTERPSAAPSGKTAKRQSKDTFEVDAVSFMSHHPTVTTVTTTTTMHKIIFMRDAIFEFAFYPHIIKKLIGYTL